MSRFYRILACGIVVGLLGVLLPFAASAHVTKTVGNGNYTMKVGFLNEPAFAGQQNGLDLTVMTSAGKPVAGLDRTLKVDAIFNGNGEKLALKLTPRFQVPGAYNGVFFPMKPGDYTFHITGTIDGTKIDEQFVSGPDTFGPVEDPAPLELPQAKQSSAAGPVFGTLDSGSSGGLGGFIDGLGGSAALGGLAAGVLVLIGAAGVWSVRRRRPVIAAA